MTLSLDEYTTDWAASQDGVRVPEPRYHLYSLSDALIPRPPREWIVGDWLSAGSVNLLVGEPGVFKTWAMAHLAVSVAMGTPWLNFKTKQGPVLIIDEESGAERLLDRLQRIAVGLGADLSAPVAFTSLAGFNLLRDDDSKAVAQLVQRTQPSVVVIDALADVMLGGDENAVKDVQPVFARLRALADQYGTAVIVIHHANKSGDYRGSSAMLGAVDLMLAVEKREGKPLAFESQKYRDGDKVSFAAWPCFSDGIFELVPAAFAPGATPMSIEEQRVFRYMHEHGASLLVEVCENTRDVLNEKARQAYYGLEAKGLAQRVDDGGKGTRAVVDLTDRGRALADEM